MSEPVLSISNLSKIYKQRYAVKNLTFDVGEGEIFGFLGPNGAGKSTTIRAILALIRPNEGEIRIFGRSVIRHRNKALKGVGALVEGPDFYRQLKAIENLNILARMERIPRSRIQEVLEITGLSNRQNDRVKAYSSGMKQRLGIAQALLSEPRLIILDEPTSGLDPKGMKEVRDLIQRLADDKITVLLSSHLLNEVEQVCTNMAIIDRGKLVVSGSVQELLRDSAVFTTEIRAEPEKEARKILTRMKVIDTASGSGLPIRIKISRDEIPGIIKKLVEAGIKIHSIVPRTSIEDYFLNLTEQDI
jgi:ABC-2 type transport system ATP-binding protein